MADIELHQVTKEFPSGVTAVHDLGLTAADGELVVLVGPSGCGKTTTLRLIAGLETPTSGTVRIGGRVVNGLPPYGRDVAMVFQRPALYPHLSVRDNLAFGLRLRRPGWWRRLLDSEVPFDERLVAERVASAARLLGLEAVLHRRPAQLSGGQQQRVALGRALVRQPAVLLLDEPLSGLDAPLRMEMRRELHLLHGRLSATMIYVTHDQGEAMALGDRVVVMDQGAVQQAGEPRALYERPVNRFVAGFIGWPPMSFLDGEVAERDGQLGVMAEGCWLPLPARGYHPGRAVTLGIRPDRVVIDGSPGPAEVVMEVALIERLGRQDLVTLRRDGWQISALLDGPVGLTERQTVKVGWDMTQVHVFDRLTGASLGQAGRSG